MQKHGLGIVKATAELNLKLDLRQRFVSTYINELQKQTLTVSKASKRKKDQIAAKKPRVLQAEQPSAT